MTDAVTTKHPTYEAYRAEWDLLRRSHAGEADIKASKTTYLSPTRSMVYDGIGSATMPGQIAYDAYLERAVFPDLISETVETLLGILWSGDPSIELPPALEPYLESATPEGEGLSALLMNINEHQLIAGRVGVFADFPRDGIPVDARRGALPTLALYAAETITNWDSGPTLDPEHQQLRLVVLNETEQVRTGFEWEEREQYRVLMRDGDGYSVRTYVEGTPRDESTPTWVSGSPPEIPFVFANTSNVGSACQRPVLSGLARRALAIYRGEADLRTWLHHQGAATLFIRGELQGDKKKEVRTGWGALLEGGYEGDAKFIASPADGLAEARANLLRDHEIAAQKGGELISQMSRQAESGEALTIRMQSKTAGLTRIARTGAAALERLLRIVGQWGGLSDAALDAISIRPNLNFGQNSVESKLIAPLAAAASAGALTWAPQSQHEALQRLNLIPARRTYEEERDLYEAARATDEDDVLGTDDE